MSEVPNPYAVTTLDLSLPPEPLGPDSSTARIMAFAAIPLMLAGAIVATIDIESIVFSGAIMLLYGIILLVATRRRKARRWFVWACVVFPLFVLLIINLFSLSPDDAQVPVSILCWIFVLASTGLLARDNFWWKQLNSEPSSL
jgi:uncharacterized membrane protein